MRIRQCKFQTDTFSKTCLAFSDASRSDPPFAAGVVVFRVAFATEARAQYCVEREEDFQSYVIHDLKFNFAPQVVLLWSWLLL